jgi:hypothetical protein
MRMQGLSMDDQLDTNPPIAEQPLLDRPDHEK